MKLKTVCVLGLFLLAADIQTGLCQQPPWVVYLHGGTVVPLGPSAFSDYRGPTLETGLGVGFPVSERFQVLVGVDHAEHPMDKQAVMDETGLSASDLEKAGGRASWWTTTLGLRAISRRALIGRAVPYVHGNLAFVSLTGSELPPYVESATFDPNSVKVSHKAPGLVLGAGLEFDAGEHLRFYVEGRLTVGIRDETSAFLPLVAGISYR
jgi:hypothetical protein